MSTTANYPEYSTLGYSDRFVKTERFTTIVTTIAFIFLVVSFIWLAVIAAKMKDTINFGNRSQAECGATYIEMETARYKLFKGYNENDLRSVKGILQVALFAIMLVLFVTYISYITSTGTDPFAKGVSMAVVVVLTLFYIAYISVNIRYSTQSKYSDNNIDSKGMIGMTSVMMVLIVSVCLLNMLYLNRAVGNPSASIAIVLFVAVFVIIFIFIADIRTRQIIDDFKRVYELNRNEINAGIKDLREDNTNVVNTGPYKGNKVNQWMNIMLAKNISRMNPSEDIGDPMDMTSNDKYKDEAYAYMEHIQGKELSELPNVETVNASRGKIRLNMRNMRRENDNMIQPIRKFTRDVNMFLYVTIAILAFLLYHTAYIKKPMITKIGLVVAILAMIAWLMISIVL